MSENAVVDTAVAATIIGCAPSTVQGLARKGEIPFSKVSGRSGGVYRFARRDVLEYAVKRWRSRPAPKAVSAATSSTATTSPLEARVAALERKYEALQKLPAPKLASAPPALPKGKVPAIDDSFEWRTARTYLEEKFGEVTRGQSFALGRYAALVSAERGYPRRRLHGDSGVRVYRVDALDQAIVRGERDNWKLVGSDPMTAATT